MRGNREDVKAGDKVMNLEEDIFGKKAKLNILFKL